MAEGFDAYHVWLGIPPEEQPPSCYRLLGIPPFEDRPEVIEHAADQRMAHLKSLAPGKHAAIAQRLLNEVAAARVRLLDAYKKAMYDQRLREEIGVREEGRGMRDEGGGMKDEGGGMKDEGSDVAGFIPHPSSFILPASPADQPTATWAPLGKLGDYQLLEKLGEGGMGTVYKAIHGKLGRLVALKVLAKDRRWDQQAIARFDREMKAVGAVDHPNIVRAMDAREVEGTRFLVMEYVEGLDLDALGRACHPIAIADACEIARQAALALQEVHRRKMVHRDVKPSNLMVTPEGVVKLLDLGLARLGAKGTGTCSAAESGGQAGHEAAKDAPVLIDEMTGSGMALGTVDYMAPEQVSDSRSVDIRADVYSLGCTLYKLLAGRTPHGGPEPKSLLARLMAHAREPVPPIRQFRGDVPAELVRILARMLEKEPKKRFSTPAEVADAVGPYATTGDLAALVARATKVAQASLPVAPAAGPQAEIATQEIQSSSGFTRFLRGIVGSPAGASVARPPSAVPKWRKNLPLAISGTAVGLLCVVAFLVWAFTRGGPGGTGILPVPVGSPGETPVPPGPRPSCLVLQWPADDRGSAMLEINGQVQDLPELARSSSAAEIRIPLKPGQHQVAVHRLGYAPFEQTFTLADDKDTVLRPTWKESGAGGQAFLPVPSVGQASLPADAKKEPPPEPKKELVKEPAPGPKAPPVVVKAEPSPGQAGMPVLLRRRELATRWSEAMGPAEALIAAWDFAGAQKAIEKVRFDEPELAARLAARRQELPKMAAFKTRIIAKIEQRISAADPPLKKQDLGLRGINGDVTGASDEGIAARLSTGKTELHRWADLREKALPKVLQLVGPAVPDADKIPAGKAGPTPDADKIPAGKAGPTLLADDSLSAGMLSLAVGNPVQAEKYFDQARSAGANIDAYLAPLAEAALARAEGLFAVKQFAQADKAIEDLEIKYGQLPWFAANKAAVSAAREAAKRGLHEAAAETLFAEAVELLDKKEFFEARFLVDKLKAVYAETRPVIDSHRKPSFGDLQVAVAKLGRYVIVRRDRKGDFTSIQAAIDAAPPNSLIEIHDNGPYTEPLQIPSEGLTIRGKKGCLPLVTSLGSKEGCGTLVQVTAARVTLERLVLVHGNPVGKDAICLNFSAGQFLVRRCAVALDAGKASLGCWNPANSRGEAVDCVFVGKPFVASPVDFRNCLCLGDGLHAHAPCDLRYCTVTSQTVFVLPGSVARDSILGSVHIFDGALPGFRMENCDVFGPDRFHGFGNPEKGYFHAAPQFRDPANLDFRLMPGSPCIGKASDGGDIGCRFTPEMIELCKVAVDLRRRGILKF